MATKRVICIFIALCSNAQATPEKFDELVHQIESGQRYFFNLADFQTALAELTDALPENDPPRSHMYNRMRCMLGYFDQPAKGIE